MKQLRYIIILLLLVNFQVQAASTKAKITNFHPGESLIYKVHYGWLDAGIATMDIDHHLHEFNGRTCYKIDVAGESKGLLYVFLKLKNAFGSYLDCEQLISQGSYRYIQEGKYRKNERVIFDHNQKLAIVDRLPTEGDISQPLETVTFPVPPSIQDIVSNWYVLRTYDFSQIKTGDILVHPIFFDEVLYQSFQTKFLGRKRIKTKLGVMDTLVLAPLVPFTANGPSIFAGENSVELYLSDDENRIPIKVKIKLVVGAVEIDLIEQRGLKHPLPILTKKRKR